MTRLSNISRAARWAVLFCVSLIAMVAGSLQPVQAEMTVESLVLITATGEHPIKAEIARTTDQKALGLMFRKSVPQGTGMLFPYDSAQEITMWMRNTYVPLDMVFIRADGTVHRVEARTEPLSERVIASGGPVTAVLELGAGEAQRLGVKPGDRVRHAHFGTAVR